MRAEDPTGRPRRIVLATFGSLGDLHPYLALARELKGRGHEPVVAASEHYRPKVEGMGIGFRPVRPDHPDPATVVALVKRILHLRKGPERLIREYMMPVIRETYEDTRAAAAGADLLVSHPLTFTVRLVAEKQGIPWASSLLQPMGLFSAHDPPVLAPAPFLAAFRSLGPGFHRPLFRLAKWSVRSWSEPWRRLRADLGLPPAREDPMFEGSFSPLLVLALFSPVLAPPQPDWPPRTVAAGFPFLDRPGEAELPEPLARFLDGGPPPVVFTLGSSAVMDPGLFHEHSLAAAARLGRRAVLLVGSDPAHRPASLPPGSIAVEYAPFAALFPRAAAVVHPGGIGTTAEAMRAGRPMLVVPHAFDQPDNAARAVRLGIARSVPRRRYGPARVERELRVLLEDPAYARRAAGAGERIRAEDGARTAADAIEEVLGMREG